MSACGIEQQRPYKTFHGAQRRVERMTKQRGGSMVVRYSVAQPHGQAVGKLPDGLLLVVIGTRTTGFVISLQQALGEGAR